ncbi:4-hydroxy-tetrahydrodipicolinate synthase [Oerskovia sp. KBS0722]|uniref:4-hydroxy-tetrahydrodipicolinate synthase n=1 Tax=Oerskovia sp. KBS0722 TaxID=1179673 RepID=UPI00110D66B0|nr:4-hydroxy-tetrahydrodipicolinate synthase [Oerskovia sp. KBS0722]QDW64268.1 4-hydroxy-tetrahydrodipicolinate synthase [Oerskovia sp. KBS0722]
MSPQQNPFGQLLVALVTPFTPDGDVAWADLERQVDAVVAGGADGLVVAGTTGEATALSDGEMIQLVQAVGETVAGRATVVAGGGSSSTTQAITHYRACEAAGADGIMVAAPAYVRPSQLGILAHLRAVADATSLPMMIYDVPARTGVTIDLPTLVLASQHPSICAIKDADGDLARAAHLITTSDLLYFAGSDAAALPTLAIDGAGVVSVAANVAPATYRQMLNAVADGDLRAATATHRRLEPLSNALNRHAPPAVATKLVLHTLGRLTSPRVRLPMVGPDQHTLTAIQHDLDRTRSLPEAPTTGLHLDLAAATGGALASRLVKA